MGEKIKKYLAKNPQTIKTIFYLPVPLNVLRDKVFFRHRFSLSQANLL